MSGPFRCQSYRLQRGDHLRVRSSSPTLLRVKGTICGIRFRNCNDFNILDPLCVPLFESRSFWASERRNMPQCESRGRSGERRATAPWRRDGQFGGARQGACPRVSCYLERKSQGVTQPSPSAFVSLIAAAVRSIHPDRIGTFPAVSGGRQRQFLRGCESSPNLRLWRAPAAPSL
jgi:hypothetical protein